MASARELDDSLAVALRSNAIEWAVNVQICDLVKENPHLAPLALARIEERLRKDAPSPVHLALSLLEMLVKNCGLIVCRQISPDLAETLVSLVKKRESWRYGFGRNLHKSGLSDWLPQGIAIGEDQRAQWRLATQKVLEILQLCVDAFMLHEGTMRPVFSAYKRLRQEGYQFPRSATGVAANLCLVNGAEDSPAYLAGAASAPQAPVMPPRPPPRPAEAEDQEIARMIGARADASERVEQLVEALEQGRDFDPQELEELITLVEDISEVLKALGVEDEEGRPKAPPPSSRPPAPAVGVRNVPAARVISESPEGLLIDDTGSAAQFGPGLAPAEPSERPIRLPAAAEDLGDPMYDAPGSAAGNALLGGGAKKRATRGWSQWAESMRSMAGSSRTRRLGDGVPRSAYSEMGEAGRPLFEGP